MNIEVWNPEWHMPILGAWLRERGQAAGAGDARLYPSTGFVVDGCAIGFLYLTNAPHIAYLDGIVTDPAASARRRHLALEHLCAALLNEAEAHGVRTLLGSTGVRGLVRICERQGFYTYATNHHLIAHVTQES